VDGEIPISEPLELTDSPDPRTQRIAGAGTLGMYLFIGSLSMLFASTIALYIIMRATTKIWSPGNNHGVPWTLWVSTVILLGCSAAIHIALNAVKKDDDSILTTGLAVTFALGLIFLLLQVYNWHELYNAIPPEYHLQNLYMVTFFLLTGLHAAHVIGGLIPLGIVLHYARLHRYSRNFHPGVRYCTIYWHFLDITWVAIFITLWIGS
jgi:cytochrome c oxidase subunit 3